MKYVKYFLLICFLATTPFFVHADGGEALFWGQLLYLRYGFFFIALVEYLYLSKKIQFFGKWNKFWAYLIILFANVLSAFVGTNLFEGIFSRLNLNNFDYFGLIEILIYLIFTFFITIIIEFPFIKILHEKIRVQNAFKNIVYANFYSYGVLVFFVMLPAVAFYIIALPAIQNLLG